MVKPLGSFLVLRHVASSFGVDSCDRCWGERHKAMCVHDFGVGSAYEEALFYTRWEGVARTALLIVDNVSIVH